MFPYYLGGFLYNEFKDLFNVKIKHIVGIVSIVLFIFLFRYFHYDSYIYNSGLTYFISQRGLRVQLLINIHRWLIGFVGVISFIYLFKLITDKFNFKVVNKYLIVLGKYSMQMYIVQCLYIIFVMVPFLEHFDYFLFVTSNIYLFNLFYTLLFAFLFSGVVFLTIKIIEKLHLNKFLFDR